jgi:hypothetical protein
MVMVSIGVGFWILGWDKGVTVLVDFLLRPGGFQVRVTNFGSSKALETIINLQF